MRIYFLNSEYESGKHRIIKVWSEKFVEPKPEDSPRTDINDPHTVIEIDEGYNGLLCKGLMNNTVHIPNQAHYDKYYVGTDGNIYDRFGTLQTINANPHKENWKTSVLYNVTNAQIDTYIDNNVTTLATAREFLKKLTKVVVIIAKQNKFE